MKITVIDSLLNKKQATYIAFLLFSWLVLITPLIDTKIIPGHDYAFHVARIIDIADGLQNGIFPVRIYANEMIFWGTPAGIFYPSLFLYIPAMLKIAGIPIEICYNLFIAFVFFLGIFSSWLGFSLLTRSKKAGFFSTLLYISSGYYLSDAYIRSAVGELIGLSFLPLAIAFVQDVAFKTKVSKRIYISGILAVSAIIQSHVLTCFFLLLFCLCSLVVQHSYITIKKVYSILLVTLVLFALNSNFLLPFLFFCKNVPLSIDYVDKFSQYGWPSSVVWRFLLLWNISLSVAVCFFIDLIRDKSCVKLPRRLKSMYLKTYFPFFVIGLFFLFMSDYAFPWNILSPLRKLFKIMQFPWRFLGLATLCFSVCGGLAINTLCRIKKCKNSCALPGACLLCIINLMSFCFFEPLPSSANWTMPAKIHWKRSIVPSDADYIHKSTNIFKLLEQGNRYISNATIYIYNKKRTNISFAYKATKNSEIVLPLIHYPGYAAVDQVGKKVMIEENDNQMILIKLPEGNGSIQLRYEGLILFTVADCLSAITLICFIVFILYHRRSRKTFNTIHNLDF